MRTTLNVIREPDEFCQPCGLYKLCKTPVMNGEGSEDPIWLFVGEAPGATEDDEGYPFCGEEGGELRQSIEDVGIPLSKCRFTNAVRCRPPGNDIKSYPKAVEHCRPHLLREIRATRPKVVVLIGNNAMKSALNRVGILKMHGEILKTDRVTYVCMFHPGYLIRNDTPAMRRKFLEALKTAKRCGEGKTETLKKRIYNVCVDRKMLQECVDIFTKAEFPATDTETSTLSPFSTKKAKLGVVGLCNDENEAWCIPLQTRTGLARCEFSWEEGLEAVKEIWEKALKWVAHNGKHDMLWGIFHDVWLGGKGHRTGLFADTMLGSYALDCRKGIHGLKDWGYRVGMANYDQPKRQYTILHPEADPDKGGNLLLVPADILYPYNMDDCICTRRTFFKQYKELKEKDRWDKPFMFPLMYHHWTALMMELHGIGVDLKRNGELDELYNKRIAKIDEKMRLLEEVKQMQRKKDDELLAEIYERVCNYKNRPRDVKARVLQLYENQHEVINLNAPEFKRELVFGKLGFESIVDKKTGPSVERWILEEIYAKEKSPILKQIIDRGTYFSAHSKYIKPVPSWVGSDGRTHTVYKIHGTETGRPSSENPNHLNLPARSKLTAELMSQFVRRQPGYFLCKQDSKQIELRLIADRAKDHTMIAEFNAGKDPHAMGAQAAYELTEAQWAELPKEEQKQKRNDCKNAVSFGLVYGRLAPALALDFGWRVSKAEKFKERYFGKYFGINEWLRRRRLYILKHGFAKSAFGRVRDFPDYRSPDEAKREAAVREGINAPIQGDASDINFLAAYRMEKWLQKHNYKSYVVMFVYDAVYLDAYYKELEVVIPKLHEFMTDREFIQKKTGWRLNVPLDTDCTVGVNLGPGMKELERKGPGQFIIPDEFLDPFEEAA